MTSSQAVQRRGFGPLTPGVYHAPYPNSYRAARALARACGDECLDIQHQLFHAPRLAPDEVAAIFVEPIQGEGGYSSRPIEFLQRLRRCASKHGILLVVDEVQSGMGRTGKMFAIEHSASSPTSWRRQGDRAGMPLGARRRGPDSWTWPPGATPAPSAATRSRARRRWRRSQLLQRVADGKRRGGRRHLLAGLKALPKSHPLIGDVRGKGLMIGVELVGPRDEGPRRPRSATRSSCPRFNKGLLVLGAGKNSIRLSPPLILTKNRRRRRSATR